MKLEPGKIEVKTDEVAEALDEIAHLAEYWKRSREQGRIPGGIKSAMIMLARRILEMENNPFIVKDPFVDKYDISKAVK